MSDSFENLGLKKEVISALNRLNYKKPTDVQKKIIPRVLAKKNVAFISQTGSGKTLAFSVGFLSKIQRKQNIQLLVVVPTRELCMQIGKELTRFGDILDFNVGIFYGGHLLTNDRNAISKRLHVVVATPGRLIQHINFKTLKVGDVQCVVFDESDQMFDHGFFEDCIYIKKRISASAQVILASATVTSKVEAFLDNFVPDYEFIEVGNLIPPSIVQQAIFCTIPQKKEILLDFILENKYLKTIIFVNTKSRLSSVHDTLLDNKIRVALLSSDLDQKAREQCLRDFKSNKFSVLVCTDVAARGLDIKDVDIVVNYDVPNRPEFYVHRIGRTGRVGREGIALSLVCPEDEVLFEKIKKEFDLDIDIIND